MYAQLVDTGVKSVQTAYSVETDFIQHEHLELVGSLFDLLILLLLVAPFGLAPLLRTKP